MHFILRGDNIVALYDEVNEVIERVRPMLRRDGGDCELVTVEDGIVKLKLLGACGSCPSATLTLKMGVERILLDELPGKIVEVQQVF